MNDVIQYIAHIDTDVFLFLNGLHNTFWDYFMYIYSSKIVWIPFYASFLYVMLRNFPKKVNFVCIIVITLIILICDQTASGLLKPMIQRMRPSNLNNPISPWVHIVAGYRGGRYGFPSSHAANSWSMAFFAMYLVRRNKLTYFLCFWALLMSYSRIYLGVHYPGDILVGALIGFCGASLSYYIFQKARGEYTHLFKPIAGPLKLSRIPILVGIGSILGILTVSGILWTYHYTTGLCFFEG